MGMGSEVCVEQAWGPGERAAWSLHGDGVRVCTEQAWSRHGPGSLCSVLSSQFLALCTLKPSLVVELARDLLEFLGSVNGLRSRASLVTSVVRRVLASPGRS